MRSKPLMFALMSGVVIIVLASMILEPREVHSPASVPSRPEQIDLPDGPYDPVLTQPLPRARMMLPINRRINDPMGEAVGMVQSEITIVTHADTIVVGWNDSAGFYIPGHSGSGYGYSVDRGDSWIDGGGLPEGVGTAVFGDPAVAVSSDGDWVYWSLDYGESPAGLTINRGRFVDSDLVWEPAVKYNDGQDMDKEYVEYDPVRDRFYAAYTTHFQQRAGRLTYSDDAGRTWSDPITISEHSGSNGYYPAPGIDGELYVTWIHPMGQDEPSIYMRYSSDGGQSWDGHVLEVAQLGPNCSDPPHCFNRGFNPNFPSPAVDRSDGPYRGRVYVVWSEGGFYNYDCYLSYSDNKGQDWSRPVKLNDNDNQTEQFWPQVSIGPAGRVSVAWIDGRHTHGDDGLRDCYITQSIDGGESWGPNRRVSDLSVSWCGVPANSTPNFGDYNELATDDRSLFAVWSDARGGDPDIFFARFDDRQLLTVTGELSEDRLLFSGDGVSWFIPNEAEITLDSELALDSTAPLMVVSTALGLLASPAEEDGIFQIARESLSGSVTLNATEGVVTGSFTLARTGPSEIDFDFDATSSAALSELDFGSEWTTEVTYYDAGDGQVSINGTVAIEEIGGTVVFSLGGIITLDGAPHDRLRESLRVNQLASLTTSPGELVLHCATQIVGGAHLADVPPHAPRDNSPPLATVSATPNPLQATTRIRYNLTQPANGSIRIYSTSGRLVRTLIDGRLDGGSHNIAFDGNDNGGRKLSAGGYFIRLSSDRVTASGKLLVLP
jgi:FlgD Ig-like domain